MGIQTSEKPSFSGIYPSNSQQPLLQSTTFDKRGQIEADSIPTSFYNLPDPVTAYKIKPDDELQRQNSMKYAFMTKKFSEDRGQSAPLLKVEQRERKSSKSSDVYIEEDDGPSLHAKESKINLIEQEQDQPIELAINAAPEIVDYENWNLPEEEGFEIPAAPTGNGTFAMLMSDY